MVPLREDMAGVVLAGGKSLRMQHDKAALPYRGTTLLEHMRHLLQQAGVTNVYFSHPTGIADIIPGKGPLSGIHAVMKTLKNTHRYLLFVPVDMPGLKAKHLQQLVNTDSTVELVRFAAFMLPFRLKVDDGVLENTEAMLAGEDYALRTFQQTSTLECLSINPADERCFANLNTPQEWQHFIGGTR